LPRERWLTHQLFRERKQVLFVKCDFLDPVIDSQLSDSLVVGDVGVRQPLAKRDEQPIRQLERRGRRYIHLAGRSTVHNSAAQASRLYLVLFRTQWLVGIGYGKILPLAKALVRSNAGVEIFSYAAICCACVLCTGVHVGNRAQSARGRYIDKIEI